MSLVENRGAGATVAHASLERERRGAVTCTLPLSIDLTLKIPARVLNENPRFSSAENKYQKK